MVAGSPTGTVHGVVTAVTGSDYALAAGADGAIRPDRLAIEEEPVQLGPVVCARTSCHRYRIFSPFRRPSALAGSRRSVPGLADRPPRDTQSGRRRCHSSSESPTARSARRARLRLGSRSSALIRPYAVAGPLSLSRKVAGWPLRLMARRTTHPSRVAIERHLIEPRALHRDWLDRIRTRWLGARRNEGDDGRGRWGACLAAVHPAAGRSIPPRRGPRPKSSARLTRP